MGAIKVHDEQFGTGEYPTSFRFVGSDGLKPQQLPADLQAWFDRQHQQSGRIVYVAFGMNPSTVLTHLTSTVHALLSSGMSVVWSLPEIHAAAAPKFEPCSLDMCPGERLFVSSWLPQQAILAHPSVGAFVSNCGMNSALESIVAEVRLVCIPQSGEQLHISQRVAQSSVGS